MCTKCKAGHTVRMSETPVQKGSEATKDEFDAMPYETLLLIAQADSVIVRALPTIEKMGPEQGAETLRKMIRARASESAEGKKMREALQNGDAAAQRIVQNQKRAELGLQQAFSSILKKEITPLGSSHQEEENPSLSGSSWPGVQS